MCWAFCRLTLWCSGLPLEEVGHVSGGVLAQRGHSAHNTRTARICQEETGIFCYYWQYSCLYTPYYPHTMLGCLMFHPTPTQASQVPE